MSTILTGSNLLLPLITYSYVSRILSTSGMGKVAFVTSILQYFSYIAMIGIPTYGMCECAKVRENKKVLSDVASEIFALNLISTFIAYVGLILVVLLVPKFWKYKLLFGLMSTSILFTTLGMEWVYKALEEYSYITKISLFFKAITVILILLFVRSENDYYIYGFLTTFTSTASYVCNFINIGNHIDLKLRKKCNLKKHLKPIMTLFSASIVITIYANFDISMIGFINTEEQVGLYSSAIKIKDVILSISTAITAVLIPRMAFYLQNSNIERAKVLINKSIRLSCITALPMAVYVMINSKYVLLFLCGGDFIEAFKTLIVLSICIVPLIFSNIFGNQILIPSGKENIYTRSVMVGALINIVLNVLLIPRFGSVGAAVGTLITECWNAFYMGREAGVLQNGWFKGIRFDYYVILLIPSITVFCVLDNTIDFCSSVGQLTVTAFLYFGIYYSLLIAFKEPIVKIITDKLKESLSKYLEERERK